MAKSAFRTESWLHSVWIFRRDFWGWLQGCLINSRFSFLKCEQLYQGPYLGGHIFFHRKFSVYLRISSDNSIIFLHDVPKALHVQIGTSDHHWPKLRNTSLLYETKLACLEQKAYMGTVFGRMVRLQYIVKCLSRLRTCCLRLGQWCSNAKSRFFYKYMLDLEALKSNRSSPWAIFAKESHTLSSQLIELSQSISSSQFSVDWYNLATTFKVL